MQISLSKDTESDNPEEIRVHVKVSAYDDTLAELVESHFFNLKDIQEGRFIAVDVFNVNPKSVDLRKYGKKLFRALFSKDASSCAWSLLQDILQPHSNRRILLELNGNHDLDVIPWEYTWGNNGYLVHHCMFARVHKRKDLQLPKLPLRIVVVVPDPVILPNEPDTNFPDLHLSDQFQNFINGHYTNNKKVILELAFPPTVDRMDALLMNNPETATALHFMGHCGSKNGSRTLIFEHNETGKPDFVATSHLLSVPQNIRLAFLSACDTRDVARVLFEHGVPYTIGSYCSLPDDLARKFESKFYQFLAGGITVEMAMWRARVFLQDHDDVRQRDYLPGAMILYSSTLRENDGAFKCEEGAPTVRLHNPRNNLKSIPLISTFCGRKEELVKLNSVLRRMANRSKQTCRMYTIQGISGQGKTALAMEAARRMAHLFPGGIFAWRFDDMETSVIEYLRRLVEIIFPDEVQSRLKIPSDGKNDVQHLGSAIVKELEDHPTCLLLLDHADTLKRAEAVDENAAALGKWLRETASTSNSTVKILATSSEALGWLGEETMHLDGLTDSGVELFIRNLNAQVKQRMETETNTTQLLQDLARLVDGHPLCLEILGRTAGKPQYQSASLKELVCEHYSTMLRDGSHGSGNLETRFRPTIDELPTQQRLLLYMCSLFNGPITEVVLAFIRYIVQYVGASSEGIDFSTKDIVENLQKLCNRKLLSKRGEEYKIHIALREGIRQCNSKMKLRLCLPKLGLCDETFVIGVAKPSNLGISVVLEWQLRNIHDGACSEVKNRNYGIQYYDIVDIPGTSGHKLERADVQQPLLFGGLIVFQRKASEILHASFSRFCTEYIIPIVTERKSSFIVCLKYTDTELAEQSTANAETNIGYMKKAMEILQPGLEMTHFIIRTEPSPGSIIQPSIDFAASETRVDNVNQPATEIDFGNVSTYGEFVGRQQELQKLEELLRDKRSRYITIRGFGGIGKTALAIQAVKNFNTGRVLVISLVGNPNSDSVISMIARFLNIDTETFRDPKTRQNEVMGKLTNGGAMLLYLDNMEDIKHATEQGDPATKNDAITLIRFFNRIPENIKVLATSRTALDWPNENFVDLNGLTPHDGMQVFRQWVSQRSDDIGDDNAMNISRLAGGHPLSIRLLGRSFNNCRESVGQFINNFGNRLRNATDLLDERYDSVDTCIQYSFDYLDDDLKSLLGQIRLFEVPFSATLVQKTTLSLTLSAENNLHKLWQQSWLNELKYDPTLGDWRPRFMENDISFYTLHPRLRDFLNHQFGNVKDAIADTLNDSEIQFYTALCYGVGFGVANDLEKQIEWCTKAAINGHLEAQLTLAVCYEEGGGGFEVDKKKAFEWHLKAAEADDKGAQYKVEHCYLWGDGVGRNSDRAAYWHELYSQNETDPLLIKFDLSLPLLHRAAEAGHVALIRSLLSQTNVNVDLKDRHGRTPLHLAAEKDHIKVFELLLSKFSADTNAKDKEGNTPVHRAAENGQVELVVMLIAEFGANANANNKDGSTPLLLAAQNGNVEVVKLLVAEFGADANAMNNSGWTPLLVAAKNGNVEVVKLLVAEFGADARVKNDDESTPLHFAAEYGNVEIVKLLMTRADANAKNNDGSTPLLIAAEYGNFELVKLLVAEFGAEANAKNNDGLTLLHWVAANGNVELVKFILAEIEADVNAKSNNGSTPLHRAAVNGNVEVVKLLVAEFGADANAKDNGGWTPLLFAAKSGNVEVVKLLVAEFGADANVKSNNGSTPLHRAAMNGSVEVVKLLVAGLRADANAKNDDGSTPLVFAVEYGHIKVVKLLVAEFGADVNAKNNDGWTPLLFAAEYGCVDIVKLLVTEFGADVNAKDNAGSTPLHQAVANGNIEAVKLLVSEFRADVNAKNNDGTTPLLFAAKNGHVEVMRLLMTGSGRDINAKNDESTMLHFAAEYGHFEVVKLLVSEFGVDANARNSDGWTLLHRAATNGNVGVVKLLVAELGADVNAKSNKGSTPLLMAVDYGNVEVLKLLVAKFGADVNAKNNNGLTPLHMAVATGNVDVVKLLVSEFMADANAKNNDGWTPLHRAATNGNVEVVELLVAEFGADANAKNNVGLTPLLFAAEYGHTEVIQLLMAMFGTDANTKNNDGSTPLHWVAEDGNVQVAYLLVTEYGADANAKNDNGLTPLHLAAHNGHVEVVKMLVEFGVDVDPICNRNATPLHHAASCGSLEIVMFLASDSGANVDALDIDGDTPLEWAATSGQVYLVQAFVTIFGAYANAKGTNGNIPLHYAVKNGHVEMVKIMVAEFGADVNAKSEDGNTSLHFAAIEGHIGMVKLLKFEFGADVNAKNNHGNTPLHCAVENGHVEMVKILVVEFKVDVNAKDEDDNSPLHFAAKEGHIGIVKSLTIEFGANVDSKDKNGCTPLHVAEQQGNVEMIKLFAEALVTDENANNMDNQVRKLGTEPKVIPQHEHQCINNLAPIKQSDTTGGLNAQSIASTDGAAAATIIARKSTTRMKTTASSSTTTAAKPRSVPKVAPVMNTIPDMATLTEATSAQKTLPARSVAYLKQPAPRDAKSVTAEIPAPAKAPSTSSKKPFTPTPAMVDEIKPESSAIIVMESEPSTPNPASHPNSPGTSDEQLHFSSSEPPKGLRSKLPSRIPIKQSASMNKNKTISPPAPGY